jgi:glycine/D-amino acid oxidase-like deaminating enzyme
MNNFSYWEREIYFDNIDVIIIGSGIVGLNAAMNLKQKAPKLKVMVLERGLFPDGASNRNAGFACFGSPSELLEDLKTHTEEEVFTIVDRRWEGLQKLRENLGDKNIGYEPFGGYELFNPNDEALYEDCFYQLGYLNKQLSPIIGAFTTFKVVDHKINKFGFKHTNHLIENVAEGQINTGKMMQSLLNKVLKLGIIVLNNFSVITFNDDINMVEIHSDDGIVINAKKLLIATDGYAKQLLPELDVKPARAQVLITKPIENLKIKGAYHFDKGFYYFRNVGNRILFGGGRNLNFKQEETFDMNLTAQIQDQLELLLRETILPYMHFEIDMRWSGIMGMGDKKSTILKNLSKNVFCAVISGGMGVAIGSLTGMEAADMVLESL